MQERLNRLESLVTTLVAQDHPPGQAKSSSEDEGIHSANEDVSRDEENNPIAGGQHVPGVLRVDDTSSVYRGSTHWRDVMAEVSRNAFQKSTRTLTPQS